MSTSREESPDWLRSFKAPSPVALSSDLESPSNDSPLSDDEDGMSLGKLFSKDKSNIIETKNNLDGNDLLVYTPSKEKSPAKKARVEHSPGGKRKRENSIAAEFLDRLVKWTENIKISDPLEDDCKLGPLVSQGQYEKVMKCISTARSEGATILYGGQRPEHLKKGYYIEPTIITDVNTNMQIWREEVFGPVLCVKTFKTEVEAIELANDTQYGLGAAVLSKDLARCERLTKAFQSGD